MALRRSPHPTAMPIQFFCPLGHVLTAEACQAGEELRCTLCGQRAIVPQLPVGLDVPTGEHGEGRAEPVVAQVPTPPAPPSAPIPVNVPLPIATSLPPSAETIASPSAVAWEDAYKADRGKLELVRWLAFGLILVAVYGAAPAVLHFRVQPAPMWIWLALFVAALQGLFIVWMVVTPDWATLRVVMLLLLLVAIGYGLLALRALGVSPDEPLPWGLDSVRPWVSRWCASVLLITSLGAYLCGHLSTKWRRAFKLELALKSTRRKKAA